MTRAWCGCRVAFAQCAESLSEKRRSKMKYIKIKTAIFVAIAVAALFAAALAVCMAAEQEEEAVNPSELGETYIGDIVADAMRAALKADAALVQGGALGYSDLPDKISEKTVADIVPFSSDLVVTVQLKGAALSRILEKGCALLPRRSSAFLQVSGVTFTCDLNKAVGKRVSSVKIGGKPLDPAKNYIVAATEFLSSGGGGMKEFRDGKVVGGDGVPIGDIVLDNARYDKKKTDSPEGRITVIPVEEKEK